MDIAVLCIGSNTPDAETNIDRALQLLEEAGCVPLSHSQMYRLSSAYLNYVTQMAWSGDYATLHTLTKEIERAIGRTPQQKSCGIVPIDIDVVIFGDEIVRPADYKADYFAYGFRLLAESVR